MRLSGFHMPRWWQALWRRRYPMGAQGRLELLPTESGERYLIEPMPCGCGYRVWWAGGQIGSHCATLGAAIRQARRHAAFHQRFREDMAARSIGHDIRRAIASYEQWKRDFEAPHGR